MSGADEDTILYLHLDTRKQSPTGTPTTDAVTHVHQGDPSHRSQERERRAAQPPERTAPARSRSPQPLPKPLDHSHPHHDHGGWPMAAGPVSRLGSFEPGDKTGLRLSPT